MKFFTSLFVTMLCVSSYATTTRVGNGDDGSDLEGLAVIQSGPIFEARSKAIEHLKKLNVQGVKDLGLLIPELENTELLMANTDVKAIDSDGDFETNKSEDKVFARTFAEPHAPTRFFPIAEDLSEDQLVALHIHEALHRALPKEVREDEDKVSLLTLSLTSPSANFDRVNKVASQVIGDFGAKDIDGKDGSIGFFSSIDILEDEKLTPGKFNLGIQSFEKTSKVHYNEWSEEYSTHRRQNSMIFVEGESSLMGVINLNNQKVEPRFGLRSYVLSYWNGFSSGPMSLTSNFVFHKVGYQIIPVIRLTIKSFADREKKSYLWDDLVAPFDHYDRDVLSLGLKYKKPSGGIVRDLELRYTFPSEAVTKRTYGAIWSLNLESAYNWRFLSIGSGFDLDHVLDKGDKPSFFIVGASPFAELKLSWVKFRLQASLIFGSGGQYDLGDLGDLHGQGLGERNVNLNLEFSI